MTTKNFNCQCGQPINVEFNQADVMTGGRQMRCPACEMVIWTSILPNIDPVFFPLAGHPGSQPLLKPATMAAQ